MKEPVSVIVNIVELRVLPPPRTPSLNAGVLRPWIEGTRVAEAPKEFMGYICGCGETNNYVNEVPDR